MDIEHLKSTIIEICKEKHGKNVLEKVDGKRSYKEISQILKIHPTTVSSILKKASTFGLLNKENEIYKKTKEFKHININRILKDFIQNRKQKQETRLRSRRKIRDYDQIKKVIKDYIMNNFKEIPHPYSKSSIKIEEQNLYEVSDTLFVNIEASGPESLKGLSLRFYDAFSQYFSVSRINKAELINAFSALVKCFEPYIKKIACLVTNDDRCASLSLNKQLLKLIIPFNSNINKSNQDYWKEKPIHEACLRVVYPYRHIESHEARDYTVFQIEKIIFFVFASIIFINSELIKKQDKQRTIGGRQYGNR